MYSIQKYEVSHRNQWNDFIAKSKNGTFLFHRDFMEYHNDRFNDFSLLVFDGVKLLAVLPSNRVGDTVHSHQGLTYGGLIYNEKIKQASAVSIFEAVLRFLQDDGICKLYLKMIPRIYHLHPSEETEYALFLANARLVRRDTLSVIESCSKIKIAANRMEGVKKGIANGFVVNEEEDFTQFWKEVLLPALEKKHGVKPVHSLAEILALKKRFPQNIRLFTVKHNGTMEAGTVIFETPVVAHAQYIAAGDNKNETGSLDFLYHHLITHIFAGKKYFDFGISNEQQGRKLNEGLAFWKESFGARTVVQDFYEVDTRCFTLLEGFLI